MCTRVKTRVGELATCFKHTHTRAFTTTKMTFANNNNNNKDSSTLAGFPLSFGETQSSVHFQYFNQRC